MKNCRILARYLGILNWNSLFLVTQLAIFLGVSMRVVSTFFFTLIWVVREGHVL